MFATKVENITGIPYDAPPDCITSLPQELFENFFFYLNINDFKSATCINRMWNIKVLQIFSRQQLQSVKNFVSFLIENLKENPNAQILEELKKFNESESFYSQSLSQTPSIRLKLRQKLIEILKKVEEKELERIKELLVNENFPLLLTNIFDVILFFKELATIKKKRLRKEISLTQL